MKNTAQILLVFILSLSAIHACAQQKQGAKSDVIATSKGELTINPIHHATFSMNWNGRTIDVDPTGGADAFKGVDAPDLILITHAHGDHLSPETLQAIDTQNTTVVMPQSVADKLDKTYGSKRVILANGDDYEAGSIAVHAMPMYNLPESDDAYHPKGWGNGYVLTLGGKRVYISGDTEGIPEMRSLKNIDLAFVCMNLPYTMDVQHAADAVLVFKPAVVYPYHYKGQDTGKFKQLVEAKSDDIEVRLRNWYK